MFNAQEAAVKYLSELTRGTAEVWDTVHYMLLQSDVAPVTCLSVLRELKKAGYVEITEDGRNIRYIELSEYLRILRKFIEENEELHE